MQFLPGGWTLLGDCQLSDNVGQVVCVRQQGCIRVRLYGSWCAGRLTCAWLWAVRAVCHARCLRLRSLGDVAAGTVLTSCVPGSSAGGWPVLLLGLRCLAGSRCRFFRRALGPHPCGSGCGLQRERDVAVSRSDSPDQAVY